MFDNHFEYQYWMEEAGFINIKQQNDILPLNPWPKDPRLKELGWRQLHNLLNGIEGFSTIMFIDVLSWTRAELEVLLINVRRDILDHRIHAYVDMVTVIGQKPYRTIRWLPEWGIESSAGQEDF